MNRAPSERPSNPGERARRTYSAAALVASSFNGPRAARAACVIQTLLHLVLVSQMSVRRVKGVGDGGAVEQRDAAALA
eukprot:COSAG02_NODE_25330_length_661_cov_5.983986_1_plen_77_part_10